MYDITARLRGDCVGASAPVGSVGGGAGEKVKMNDHVDVLGKQYDVSVEQLPGTRTYIISGNVMGQWLRIERRGHNAALAGWREAARQKLKNGSMARTSSGSASESAVAEIPKAV